MVKNRGKYGIKIKTKVKQVCMGNPAIDRYTSSNYTSANTITYFILLKLNKSVNYNLPCLMMVGHGDISSQYLNYIPIKVALPCIEP